ncbi:MAG: sulfur carrier protein ThiS [Crocinitomicaceae bacterium]|jgi:sulfur carrier protein|nr:sulfur carrier protein ThiS [Crocinitomicaceae bacterium]MBT5403993.1 sulfur carrier protein ThiS [Crocinitomicaceae bacterium]MBT6030882.1 sulfur carrier protein ThiS [Crocinitomicaceae bacterium]MBT6513764.1 sulfur carrier protein ThiS [Crocinitomicaceae bacterium]MDG2331739.1 sulfur carrier protein ThiS [Flavobacteriales bacterium]
MTIYLNGKKYTVDQNSLEHFLKAQFLWEKQGIALAINDSIVSKANWKNVLLYENDKLLIITATQGG